MMMRPTPATSHSRYRPFVDSQRTVVWAEADAATTISRAINVFCIARNLHCVLMRMFCQPFPTLRSVIIAAVPDHVPDDELTFRAFLDSSVDNIYVIDKSGRFRRASRGGA